MIFGNLLKRLILRHINIQFQYSNFNRGSEIYPPVSPYDMMNQIGASTPPGGDDDGVTTSALVMGGGDHVVAGYSKDEGVVNLLYFETRFMFFLYFLWHSF